MRENFLIEDKPIKLKKVMAYIFSRKDYKAISLDNSLKNKTEKSFAQLLKLIEKKTPIYGVTTGFGDSCYKSVPENSVNLQENLVSYLLCGTGNF